MCHSISGPICTCIVSIANARPSTWSALHFIFTRPSSSFSLHFQCVTLGACSPCLSIRTSMCGVCKCTCVWMAAFCDCVTSLFMVLADVTSTYTSSYKFGLWSRFEIFFLYIFDFDGSFILKSFFQLRKKILFELRICNKLQEHIFFYDY